MTDFALTTDELRILRALKKTAILFVVLLRLSRPAGTNELARLLETTPSTVRIQLQSLAAVGLAAPTPGGAGWQLSLAGCSFLFGGCANLSPATTAGFSPPDQYPPAAAEAAPLGEAHAALRQAGIGEPTASRLAALEHVTPGFVTAHVLRARQEKTPTGLLVHRLRANDPAPALNERGHLMECKCDACQRARYAIE